MAFTLIAAFLSAWAMQRVLRLDSVTATLIGVGTAICGGSAIAATAPVIDQKGNLYGTAANISIKENI